MEKLIRLVIVFFFFLSQTIVAQIFNPTIDRKEVAYCDILRIEKSSTNTIVYFKYTAPSMYTNGGWVCAGGDFFIRDINTNNKYKLIKANNIPICPEKKNFQYKFQELEFNLVFEPMPSNISKIDIIEDEKNGGFNFFGVNLSSTPNYNNSPQQPTIINNDCDIINYIAQTPKPEFSTMLAGVKNAIILETSAVGPSVTGLEYYLKAIGFESVKYLNYVNGKVSFPIIDNPCETVWVKATYKFNQSYFYDIKLIFTSGCTDYSYEFSSNKSIKAGEYNKTDNNFYELYREMYGYKKYDFNPHYTVKMAKEKTCWTENKLKDYFKTNGIDKIEGIYESSTKTQSMLKYKLGVKKINDIYYLIYLSGAEANGEWDEGEIKATLTPTATSLFFKAKWFMSNKSINDNFYVSFENGLFNTINNNEKNLFIKLYPTAADNFNKPLDVTSSGTGFAISSNGYIITNHHVTVGANSIKVRGVNGDFSKTYSAKVVIEDKNNDLTIIKIDDPKFNTLGKIPYTILSKASDVGSSVFVLGYPLRASMGDEVKLTNGIISSKSGFQGDITSYQITAPIQSGNSGGPLFDYKGNIIGIINAKHGGAENVSYAIKSSYLLNLIDMMSTPIKLETISEVSGKSLPEQVKILKKYSYIIEIN